jgi:hypothetical protein
VTGFGSRLTQGVLLISAGYRRVLRPTQPSNQRITGGKAAGARSLALTLMPNSDNHGTVPLLPHTPSCCDVHEPHGTFLLSRVHASCCNSTRLWIGNTLTGEGRIGQAVPLCVTLCPFELLWDRIRFSAIKYRLKYNQPYITCVFPNAVSAIPLLKTIVYLTNRCSQRLLCLANHPSTQRKLAPVY